MSHEGRQLPDRSRCAHMERDAGSPHHPEDEHLSGSFPRTCKDAASDSSTPLPCHCLSEATPAQPFPVWSHQLSSQGLAWNPSSPSVQQDTCVLDTRTCTYMLVDTRALPTHPAHAANPFCFLCKVCLLMTGPHLRQAHTYPQAPMPFSGGAGPCVSLGGSPESSQGSCAIVR